MATFLLATVSRSWGQSSVALPADHLVTVVLLGENSQTRFNHTSSQTQHKVESRFLLDVVVTQSTSILKLFPSKDETLLIWRDTCTGEPKEAPLQSFLQSLSVSRRCTFFVLYLSLDVLYRVASLHFKRDGLPS